VDDPLDTALTHVSTVYGLYVTQRQNVVNFYLTGVALLSVAYAAAIDKHRAPVAVAVCALGVLASAAAYLQDMRLRSPMRFAEKALRELQAQLAGKVRLDSAKIQAAIGGVEEEGLSRGTQIRAIYGAAAVVFVLGAVYASLAH
jgi:hypothetical protein